MKEYLTHLTCEHCSKAPTMFVPPEVPVDPNIILIGEGPGYEELQQKRPFVGESGQVLRSIVRATGARPIILNSVNTYDEDKPNLKQIKMCREAHLLPILNDYPKLPVVALGTYAAEALLGGKRGEESTFGKVLWKYGRNVLFTYHPAHYLWSYHDQRVYEHVMLHIKSALTPEYMPKFEEGIPDGLTEIVVDIEADTTDYPQYNSVNRLTGIMDLATGKKYLQANLDQKAIDRLNKAVLVVGHHIIYDLVHLGYRGVLFPHARFFDTLIYQKHAVAKELDYGLKYLGKRLGMPPYEAEFRTYMDSGVITRDVPKNVLYPYNANDLEGTARLYYKDIASIPSFELDMKYLRVVRDMTLNGIRVNTNTLHTLQHDMLAGVAKLERKARKLGHLGKDFNFNSHPQKKAAIEEAVGHKVPDTKKETLEDLKHESPMIAVLLDLSHETKLAEQVEGIREKVTKDKLVHSQFSPNGTETSRLSSSNPNLQNKHVRTRAVFVSRYGR